MGDGYFYENTLKLCTDNFTKDEVLTLKVLYHIFGLKATMNKRTNPSNSVVWTIRISRKSMGLLKSLVIPYLIPEMLYKLDVNN